MNLLHGWFCSSKSWANVVERSYLPWALEGVNLGENALEIGPGYGATTRLLAARVPSLTALELDAQLADKLEAEPPCTIVRGDGTKMPFDRGAFDAVTCFTMLHHVPSPALQDKLFAEAFRVLRPGGTFAGADSMTSLGFRLLHIGDTMVLVDPDTLPRRLEAVGFEDVKVAKYEGRAFRFSATKR